MNEMMLVHNNGPEIVSTNYWQSEQAQHGYVYLSINAGCFRLLIPSEFKAIDLDEAARSEVVLITRGDWQDMGKINCLELLFEDNSDNPYCINISPGQYDIMPNDDSRDRPGQDPRWRFAAYTEKDGKIFELPARFRKAQKIPYLKPWQG